MNKRYETIRRIVVSGKVEEKQAAWDFLERNGYRFTLAGPMPIAWKEYDDSRFKIVAEKEIKSAREAKFGNRIQTFRTE